MRKSYDDRDVMVPKLQAYEDAILKELAASQVTHHTEEYAVGSERYEKLMVQLAEAQRFSWSSNGYAVNI